MLKRIIYVWSWPDMSMKWVGCLNHNLQHAASERPSESPTAATVMWDHAHIRLRLCPHAHQPQWKMLKRIIYVWSWPDMSMKWVGSLNHNLQHAASERPSESPLLLRDTKHISGWGCVHMTTSHSGRCWNAFYVWSWPDMSMKWVGCLNHNLQHATSERDSPISYCCHCDSYQVRVASLWPLATVEDAETHYICMTLTWYEYEVGGEPQS